MEKAEQWHTDRLGYACATLQTATYNLGLSAISEYCNDKQRYCPQVVATLYSQGWVSLFGKGGDIAKKLDSACNEHTQKLLHYQLEDVTFIWRDPSQKQMFMRLKAKLGEKGLMPYRMIVDEYVKLVIPLEMVDYFDKDAEFARFLDVEHNKYVTEKA
ncbi:hypothetical protein M409DRAFT_31134 [Zasmidium cellare ATCC 36951]|uniref:Uncharacterized protein n=1 Tax=Zasmidium cellare ATCC 36951 TaxID=1080233 RepID=A0A6A6BXQ2_ZASCE|nr:uncharacterized protein M409DRAFT_31134 [Zasmidium cellare ATCC 36951]KAF2158332.1 hypothetical protein M409DRAFT_31134 [Zasmidium cellare ATCC 36951]